MKLFKTVLVGFLLSTSNAALSTVITYGNLTTNDDGTTNTITDTVTGREYLRFDTFNLSYADTVTATTTGAYADYTIADGDISDDFINALFGSSTICDGAATRETCGILSMWTDADLGSSYTYNGDYFAYIGGLSTDIGLVNINGDGKIQDIPSWSSTSFLDYYGCANSISGCVTATINLLLYKDVSTSGGMDIPEPSIIVLFTTGLFGIGYARRRRSKAL